MGRRRGYWLLIPAVPIATPPKSRTQNDSEQKKQFRKRQPLKTLLVFLLANGLGQGKKMKPETKHNYIQRINRVVSYLNQQGAATPSLQDLADIAAISPFHFHRVYRAITGETPSGTIRRLRLARAAAMLKETAKSITEIAFDVGYESSQSFSKAFREATGRSASDLRNEPKKLTTAFLRPAAGRYWSQG